MNELILLREINENVKRLLAVVATQSMDDEKKLRTLKKMGFTSPQISEMTGIPEATIRMKWNDTSNGKKQSVKGK